MRQILTVLIVLIAAAIIAFNCCAGMRETLRSWRASGDEAERLDAYAQGKTLFLTTSTENSPPHFEAWGDDRYEDAQDVSGDIWLAHGHFTTDSSTVSTPWCVLFQLNQGSPIIRESGPHANEAIFLTASGHFQAAINRFGTEKARAAAATPRPGAWMWEHHSPLDDPPTKGHR